MKTKVFILFWYLGSLIYGQSTISAQPIPLEDPHRGISVDKFLRLNNTSVNAGNPQIDTCNSILAVDKDNDGIYEKEVQLVQFCNNNHITQISLYDVGNVFREYTVGVGIRDELMAWDETTNSYQYLRWHLCRFIQYAKSHGIDEIMVSLAGTSLANQVTSAFRFSPAEKNNVAFNSDLLAVENPSNDGNLHCELLKLSLRVLSFNSSNPCNVKVDGFTYESEFWNAERSFEDVRLDLKDLYLIKELFNSLNPSDPIFLQLYFQTPVDPISNWNSTDIIDFIDGCNLCNAFFDQNGISTFPPPNPRIVDRVLMVFYGIKIFHDNYFNSYGLNRPAEFRATSTNDYTYITPFINTESRQFGGAYDYLGDWLNSGPSPDLEYTPLTIHNLFTAEEALYSGYLDEESLPASNFNNVTYPGSALYFESSQMIGHLDKPKTFYLNSPFNLNTASTIPLLVNYCGPFEDIRYDFSITKGASVITSLQNQSVPVIQASPSANNYPINVSPSSLLQANNPYTATMTLHYNRNGSAPYDYTYSRNFYVYSDNLPHLEIINDSDPSTPDEDSRCEGDPIVVQAGGNINNGSFYSIDNGPQAVIGDIRSFSFSDPGIHHIQLFEGSNVSEVKTLTIFPNPNVQIIPDCNFSTPGGDIGLTAVTLGNGSNTGNLYLWSTGERTQSITANINDYSNNSNAASMPYYVVTVTNNFGCTRKDSYRTPPDDPYNLTALTPPSVANFNITPYNCASPISLGSVSITLANSLLTSDVNGIAFLSPGGSYQSLTVPHGGTTTISFSNLLPGDYTFYFTDAYTNQRCATIFPFTISSNTNFGITSNITSVTTCGTANPYAPDNSGAIDLSISGTGNYQYQWSNLETTEDLSNLEPGTYTVLITDINSGCQEYHSYDVNFNGQVLQNDLPFISSISTSDEQCPGSNDGEMSIHASQIHPTLSQYDILLSNGLNGCTSCSSSFAVSNIPTGTYTLTLIEPVSGCRVDKYFHIGSTSAVAFNASTQPSCSALSDGIVEIDAIGGSGQYTYSYSPNSVGLLNDNEISSLPTGNYDITVTDANCVSNTITTNINVGDYVCCQASGATINIPNSGLFLNNIAPTTTTYTNELINMNGDILIDDGNTLQLIGCTVEIATGKKITIKNGGYLEVNSNSLLHSCNNDFWKGIIVEPGGSVIIDQSNIEDAENGVYGLGTGTSIELYNCTFSHNQSGVSLNNGIFSNFISDGVNYIGSQGLYPNYGINLNNVSNISVGDPSYSINTFNALSAGIYSLQSDVTVRHCTFNDNVNPCSLFSIDCYNGQGSGILAIGSSSDISHLVVGGSAAEACVFNNFTNGIYMISNVELVASFNRFDNIAYMNQNSSYGVYGLLSRGALRNIHDNTFNRLDFGVSLMKSTEADVMIQNNIFNDFLTVPVRQGDRAITLWDTGPPSTVVSQSIYGNLIRHYQRGISLTYQEAVNVMYNTMFIDVFNPTSMCYGIRVLSGRDNFINNNTIMRNLNDPDLAIGRSIYGITTERSSNNRIIENDVFNLGSGIRFYNTFNNITSCNQMVQNVDNFVIEASVIGDQGSSGSACDNYWIINSNTAQTSGGYGNVLGIGPQPTPRPTFYVQDGPGTPWNPDVGSGDCPGICASITAQTDYPISSSGSCNNISCIDPSCVQQMIIEIIEEQAEYANLPDEQKEDAKKYAFELLIRDSTLMYQGTILDAELQQFYDEMKEGNPGMFSEIVHLLGQEDNNGAIVLNSNLTPDNLSESNQQLFNEIYLSSWANNSTELGPDAQSVLEFIAYQNPYTGGDAVYSARVMLGLDIADYMNESEERLGRKAEGSTIFDTGIIVPNPNSGKMQYIYSSDLNDKAIFQIFSSKGMLIKEYLLSPDKGRLDIDLSDQANGIYVYRIVLDNKIYSGNKIILQR